MFRKLVSNLPFSPALVGQIGFYARRLRKEEATRRLGLFMTVLALIVQSFTVFIPSTSANASNVSDMISGGVSSVSDILRAYDNPNTDYKKIMDYIGISRSELASLKKSTINSIDYGKGSGTWLTWGRVHKFSAAQGEVQHDISGTVVYSKPLWLYDTTSWTTAHGSMYSAFVGTSAKMGTFAIMMGCGNAITRSIPPAPKKIAVCRPGVGIITINETEKAAGDLPTDSDACKPKVPTTACTSMGAPIQIDRTHYNFTAVADAKNGAAVSGYIFTIRKADKNGAVVATKTIVTSALSAESGSIELKDAGTYYASITVKTSLGDRGGDNCATSVVVTPPEEVVESKTATNLTQGGDASKKTADAGDRIQYTITVSNPGTVPANASFVEQLDDVLEYSTIQDNGGGTFDTANKSLSWNSVKLAAGETQTRTFIVALPATIPTTAQGSSEPSSYDCIMSNTFGNNVQIPVQCSVPKIVEQTTKELPSTGPNENIAFGTVLLVIVTFFWARSRQLGKEIRLVRKDFSASTI